jgi:hypothetical protein
MMTEPYLSPSGMKRSAPIVQKARDIAIAVLGERGAETVKIEHQSPTGLIRDGMLFVSENSVQTLVVSGSLDTSKRAALIKGFILEFGKIRSRDFIPIVVQFDDGKSKPIEYQLTNGNLEH